MVTLYAVGLLFVEFKMKGPYWVFVVGPFFASVFVGAGYYLRKRDIRISAPSALTLAAAGLCLQFLERSQLLSYGWISETDPVDYYLGTLPFGIGIFLFAMNVKSTSFYILFLSKLGRFTLGFYLVHILFIWIFEPYISRDSVQHSLLLSIIVIISSVSAVLVFAKIGIGEKYLR